MKSHFQFSNKQRSGIFLLVSIIAIAQVVYAFVDFSNHESPVDEQKLEELRQELEVLRAAELETSQPKIHPFNPNYITDYKGYTLGMSNEEIDRLLKFREGNQWVNSASEFQKVTQVSDSLLAVISPYFKFPDWVSNPDYKTQNDNKTYSKAVGSKTVVEKIDLNIATSSQLQKVYGVGEKLAERIINYRKKFEGGFLADIELTEVWGLSPEVIERIKNEFTVKTPRVITKVNLNTATRDELVKIQYIDYEVANNILEERALRDGFKSLEELTKVEDFPIKKIDIIKLYLHL